MKKIKLDERIFLYEESDSKKYLVNLESSESYELNQMSYLICLCLQNDYVDFETLIDFLYKSYDCTVEKEILKADVKDFLKVLFDESLITLMG